MCCFFLGCQTTPKKAVSPSESRQEAVSAIGSVAGAWTGKEVTDEEARRVVQNIQKDKEGQSAIQSIGGGMSATGAVIKFCPVDGKHFSADLEFCPEHHVKLKEVVE